MMSMKMRTQITKVCISFLLFCSYSFYAWGQSKLDDVIISNIKVEKEIATLKSQLDIYNDSIKKVKAEIANSEALLKKVMHQKDSLEYKKSKDFLAKLNKEVISLDSLNNALLMQIKGTKRDMATKHKELANNQSVMLGMGAFSVVQRERKFEENLQYTKRRFSQIDLVKLQRLLDQSNEFSDMNKYDEYVKRLRSTIANMNIFNDGVKAISTPFNEEVIVSVRERIIIPTQIKNDNLKKGIFKLTSNQFSELDSLDIKLSRFKGGMKALKKLIVDINSDKQIASIRLESNNRSNRTQLLNLIKPYIIPEAGTDRKEKFERYFKMVPYLEKLLKQYWNEIKSNPFFVPTKTESIIVNTIIEE